MKCPKECPHNWPDCLFCANLPQCKAGTYIPEPEPEPEPEPDPEVNELEENELTTDLGTPIPSTRGTWAERFSQMSEDERWSEMYRYHPPDLISKEPITCLTGPFEPGGGKSGKVKKSKKGNKPTVYVWGENP